MLAQTAGSSGPPDGAGGSAGGALELVGDVTPARSQDGSDLTAGVVLDDGPLPGATVDGRPAPWQRVAAGFLLGYGGASRAAYAADLRDYLSW